MERENSIVRRRPSWEGRKLVYKEATRTKSARVGEEEKKKKREKERDARKKKKEKRGINVARGERRILQRRVPRRRKNRCESLFHSSATRIYINCSLSAHSVHSTTGKMERGTQILVVLARLLISSHFQENKFDACVPAHSASTKVSSRRMKRVG